MHRRKIQCKYWMRNIRRRFRFEYLSLREKCCQILLSNIDGIPNTYEEEKLRLDNLHLELNYRPSLVKRIRFGYKLYIKSFKYYWDSEGYDKDEDMRRIVRSDVVYRYQGLIQDKVSDLMVKTKKRYAEEVETNEELKGLVEKGKEYVEKSKVAVSDTIDKHDEKIQRTRELLDRKVKEHEHVTSVVKKGMDVVKDVQSGKVDVMEMMQEKKNSIDIQKSAKKLNTAAKEKILNIKNMKAEDRAQARKDTESWVADKLTIAKVCLTEFAKGYYRGKKSSSPSYIEHYVKDKVRKVDDFTKGIKNEIKNSEK